jgi:pimeloyl-ACP methyl ester carboxylesterase
MPRVKLPGRKSSRGEIGTDARSALLSDVASSQNHNSVEIEYDTFGNPSHPAIVLVHGLNAQTIHWLNPFFLPLVAADFFVVRLDNRDAGLSTHFLTPESVPLRVVKKLLNALCFPVIACIALGLGVSAFLHTDPPNLWTSTNFLVYLALCLVSGVIMAIQLCCMPHFLRFDVTPPYTLDDMAGDVLGLMSFLNIESAHLVGASVRASVCVNVICMRHSFRV